MDEILVVGLSARALAEAARADGYAPLAADLFHDADMEDASVRSGRIEGMLEGGFKWEPLSETLIALADGRSPIGIVCGTGFEDRTELLDRLAERWSLIGNLGRVVARIKDPAALASLCRDLDIPHPAWADRPGGPDWLSKRAGGAGGSHIGADGDTTPGRYWQEGVAGQAVSALVLGAGERAMIMGLSSQWADPRPDAPYRYGGAVRPAIVEPEMAHALSDAAERMSEAAGLVGLNSVDFLVGVEQYTLIEVNPRPGATLDIFRPASGGLFAAHVAACDGRLPVERPVFEGAAAACIAYADRGTASVPDIDWPEWASDRQRSGTRLGAGAPLCTVRAEAETPQEARRLVEERKAAILARLDA